ncbi:probable protein phosphatase 2C 11 isoform X2 [Physcomitrium patens]|nr:probable protein phosphatase 2C 11 isoform X2 [Physcomitrium patens]|eukprot:XP_024373389.1 probable protein phosphatase 2C 11 isoform X2 [Physcomitrella patens]
MGIYLCSPKTDKTSEDDENAELRYGLSAMQGWRDSMEDAHKAILNVDKNTSTSIFGIFDGHGGKLVAKFCAKHLHQEVLKSEAYAKGDLKASLEYSFLRMDEMMKGASGWKELQSLEETSSQLDKLGNGNSSSNAREDDESDYSYAVLTESNDSNLATKKHKYSDFQGPIYGSTAVVALIRGNKLFVANAGDSRCIMSRRGEAVNLSIDHKPNLEHERKRIESAGGFVHGGRVNGSLNLTRAIGDMEFKGRPDLPPDKQVVTCCPDVVEVDLGPGDEFIVLACDGIWDVMSSQAVVDFVKSRLPTVCAPTIVTIILSQTKTLSSLCEEILDYCLSPTTRQQEGCDNMSIIIVQPKQSGVAASSSTD